MGHLPTPIRGMQSIVTASPSGDAGNYSQAGAWQCMVAATCSNAASISRICGEWKGMRDGSRCTRVPCFSRLHGRDRVPTGTRRSPCSPGALSAAIVTRSSKPASARGRAPGPPERLPLRLLRTLCIRRARSAMSFSPSSSENTPATQAATYSPTLWPATARAPSPAHPQSCQRIFHRKQRRLCVHRLIDPLRRSPETSTKALAYGLRAAARIHPGLRERPAGFGKLLRHAAY